MTNPCQQILNRHFIAIATGSFEASGSWPPLDVAREVVTMRAWLCNPALGGRMFSSAGHEQLSDRPDRRAIEDAIGGARFMDGDAVILYVTGHGDEDDGVHYTVLEKSEPGRLAYTAVETVNLVRFLASNRDLQQVLLILDLCYAGKVADQVTSTLRNKIPDTWIGLMTTPAEATAKVGAFTDSVAKVVELLRTGFDRDATNIEPYVHPYTFIESLKTVLWADHRQDLEVLRVPFGTSCCLPNPKFDPTHDERVPTTSARRDLAVLKQDMTAHWGPRAPAIPGASWLFAGRAKLMARLIDFAQGPPGTLVLTGRAGSGKSAVLARLVTCSDREFRAAHRELIEAVIPLPPEGAVDIAVLATGKSAEQMAAQIAGALGDTLEPATLDAQIEAIRRRAAQGPRRPTVVIDALDEASDPILVTQTLLRLLNPPFAQVLRLVIGVRSTAEAGEQGDASRGRDLADIVAQALDAERVAADDDRYWESGDLEKFVGQILTHDGSPYETSRILVPAVAQRVALSADRSYLLALLVARDLAERADPLKADSPELQRYIAGGVSSILAEDLRASLPDEGERQRAALMLRACALSVGKGLPWRGVWPTIATSIAPRGIAIDDQDIAWLLSQRVAGYLIRDIEDGVTVYRPFHDALRASLQQNLPVHALGARQLDVTTAHARIAKALQEMLPALGDPHIPTYVRRYLADHAARGGVLDETVLTAERLPLLDGDRLSNLIHLTEVRPNTVLWFVLSAYRGVQHRWTWDRPDVNAAALDMALSIVGSPPPDRTGAGLGWRPRWADWYSGGMVVSNAESGTPHIAFGTVQGRTVLAVSSDADVQIMEPATGKLLGAALAAGGTVRGIAMATVSDTDLVAAISDAGHIRVWDAATGRPMCDVSTEADFLRWVDLDALSGRAALVAGGASGSSFVWDVFNAELVVPVFGTGRSPPRGIALNAETGTLAIGRGDGSIELWQLDPPAARELNPAANVGSEVNAVAWGGAANGRFLAIADADGQATIWHPATGSLLRMTDCHSDEARAVATGERLGGTLVATAGFDRTVRVWDASGNQIGEPIPHPAPVHNVAFGTVDGRVMLATGAQDGATRLWDPVQPFGVRQQLLHETYSVAMLPDSSGLLLAAAGRSGVVYLRDAVTGRPVSEVPIGPGLQTDSRATKVFKKAPSPRRFEVALGVVDSRRVLATTTAAACQVRNLDNLDADVVIGEYRPDAGLDVFGPVAWHLDGDAILAVAPRANTVHLIDPLLGKRMRSIPTKARVETLALVRLGGLAALAIGTSDWIKLHDAHSGSALADPIPAEGWIAQLTVGSIDGVDVLAWSGQRGLTLWNIDEGRSFAPSIPMGPVRDAVLATVGNQPVLITTHRATVRVWDPWTGRMLTALPFGTSIGSTATAAAPDGRLLVAVSGQGVVVAELRLH